MNEWLEWNRIFKQEQNKMKTFGELTREEQIKLVVARYVDGKDIEKLIGCNWYDISNPDFNHDEIYRAVPDPASVNWDHVGEGFVQLFYDAAFGWSLHNPSNGKLVRAGAFASFKPGDESTKVYRPGYDEAGQQC